MNFNFQIVQTQLCEINKAKQCLSLPRRLIRSFGLILLTSYIVTIVLLEEITAVE